MIDRDKPVPTGSYIDTQIDEICDEFEDAWRHEPSPPVHDYYQRLDGRRRKALAKCLIEIDVEHRCRCGQSPSPEDYSWYHDVAGPEAAEEVQSLIRSTVSKTGGSTDPFGKPNEGDVAFPRTTHIVSAHGRLGDYVLQGELGRGGMGVVYKAAHVERRGHVALKLLPKVDGTRLHHFKREFRSLADMAHPNVIGLQTLESDGDHWFFTMDLVEEANDFLSYVRPAGKLDAERLWSAFAQLVTGLRALHEHRILHCDLKPSNVLVDGDGRVLLLDFGLVAELDRKGITLTQELVAGTPAYMAPEQAAGRNATTACDWYTVGLMLYEAICGQRPFKGKPLQLIRQKQEREAPPLPGAPEQHTEPLAELCMQLLARDPARRPRAAQIAALIPEETQAVAPMPAAPTPRKIVGRDAELTQLAEIAAEIKAADAPVTVMVEGRSGEGKTVLVEEFLEPLRGDARYTILSGRCYDRESVPFKALDNLIDALASHLRMLPKEEAAMLMPRDIAVLAELFPVLQRVEVIAKAPRKRLENLDEQQVRKRAFGTLRELVERIADRSRLIFFIDDLQWGDSDSAEALFEVLRPEEAPPVMLLASYRTDEADRSAFLNAWRALQEANDVQLDTRSITLGPLDQATCQALLAELTGGDETTGAAEIITQSEGNPYLLTEMASCYDSESGVFHRRPLHEVIQAKVGSLATSAAALLDMVAVAGQAIGWADLSDAVGGATVDYATVVQMRNAQLVRMIESGDETRVDTYHDKIRESVLTQLPHDRLQHLHRQLAESIERRAPDLEDELNAVPILYDLAYHFFEAGDKRAFDYQLRAGEAAIRTYAAEKASDHLRKAAKIIPPTADRATRYRVHERLGFACGKTRELDEAVLAFQRALPHAASPVERAVVLNEEGQTYVRQGNHYGACRSFDLALAELGYERPKTSLGIALQISWFLTVCHLRWMVRRHRSESDRDRAALLAEIYYRLIPALMSDGHSVAGLHAVARGCHQALRNGRTDLIALGLSKTGLIYSMGSMHTPGRWMLLQAQSLAEKSEDDAIKSEAKGFLGSTHYCSGRLEQAENELLGALETLDRYGESYIRSFFNHVLRHLWSLRGDSHQEMVHALVELADSDREVVCWGNYGMADAKARLGLLQEAHEHMRLAAHVDVEILALAKTTRTIMLHTHGFVHLQSSDYTAAVDVLRQALRIMRENNLYIEFTVRAFPLLVEALLGPDWTTPQRSPDMRHAQRLLMPMRYFGWRFPSYRPHALRMHGRLSCRLGRPHRAKRYFKQSIQVANEIGEKYDAARAQLDLAAVEESRREELIAAAVETLAQLQAVVPYAEKWQLGEHADETCIAPPWPCP